MAGHSQTCATPSAAASGAVAGSGAHSSVAPTLERPKKAGFGDYATNAAMLLAPRAGVPPRDVAGQLAERARASASERRWSASRSPGPAS